MSSLAIANTEEIIAQNPSRYRALIQEVYLKPIRSVLIVDDDFPTLESYLSNKPEKDAEHIERLKNLIETCRISEGNWLVDVHDGSDLSTDQARDNLGHLHQSDLLVLDYHLDGSDDNRKSLKILQRLAENDHFNLVVVYTKGYGEGESTELTRVAQEIILALTEFPEQLVEAHKVVSREFEDWEGDEPNILRKLLDLIDTDTLIEALGVHDLNGSKALAINGLSALRNELEARQIELRSDHAQDVDLSHIAPWLLAKKAEENRIHFAAKSYGGVNFSIKNGRWIRTDRLFVTVVGKKTLPKDIPEKLLDSLEHWKPSPHRLLMAKIRSELDSFGVGAESTVLNKKLIQAGWMEAMIKAPEDERPWQVGATTARHWEEMASATQANIQGYAKQLFEHIRSTGSVEEIVKTFTGIDLKVPDQMKDVKLHINCHVCSKPVDGYHLVPGHILKIVDGEKSDYWLCLSPACDLVPGQGGQRWGQNKLQKLMPFKAVLLHRVTSDRGLKGVNTNEFIFVNVESDIAAFRFVESEGASPKWEQMFAHDGGALAHGTMSLNVTRLEIDDSAIKTNVLQANVVAQLRYEYALNLLQRLGISLSRVGLDFVKHG